MIECIVQIPVDFLDRSVLIQAKWEFVRAPVLDEFIDQKLSIGHVDELIVSEIRHSIGQIKCICERIEIEREYFDCEMELKSIGASVLRTESVYGGYFYD